MCYAELGYTFGVGDPDTGIYYLKQALILYLKLADVAKEAHALFAIGTLASRLPPPPPLDPPTPTQDLSATATKASQPSSSSALNRSVSTSSMGSNSSRTRRSLHPSQTAFNYISQARRLFARLGLAKGQAECAYQLGKLSTRHGPRGELEAAVVLFEEACDKFREAGGAEVDEAWSMYRLALVMLKVRSSTLAIDYLAEARRLFRDAATDERKAEGSCLLRIGEIYAAAGEAEKAKLSIEEVRRPRLRILSEWLIGPIVSFSLRDSTVALGYALDRKRQFQISHRSTRDHLPTSSQRDTSGGRNQADRAGLACAWRLYPLFALLVSVLPVS